MSIDMKHNNGAAGVSMAADRHADVRALAMGGMRFRSDLTGSERDAARAAIDDAMQSVSHVLEVAIQAMGNLRVARAALGRCDDGPPNHANMNDRYKSS
ncbi:hypothetical protein WT67_04115 [Burkholderia stagnalis]|uniref:Uncharacterized protein n=2 Tax=Burkholderia stagnalis TaxID=1503054 RepID=A0A6L3N3Y4_9BURK|nr:hypothetical protein [Burkholderia stagnalis]KAB0640870.1 hypothetical protein F7R25_02470 [Burkholderia stagnalis]KVW80147.1 hypothetical protein WT29_13900 [Burkholderia stagnalis]KWH97543.1 hypothetical protein WT67_04115 [Burkholderia stagnalis]KWH98669.1 hypothetical protein WT68_04525 [Burkholderia stagnalis]KWI05775.1 hypothetical protein WT70_24080 [Burkholderia stagnalis]